MGINVGAAVGPFICGLVGDTGNPADFKWAFLAAGIGMSISVIVQKIFQRKYVIGPDNKVLGSVPEDAPKIWNNPVFRIVGVILLSFIMIGLLYTDAKVVSYLAYVLVAATILIAVLIFSDRNLSAIAKQRIAGR